MIVDNEAELYRQYAAEQIANKDFDLQVGFALPVASAVIACLQLSLRHPGNTGHTARLAAHVVGRLIARMRELGFSASAQVAELGSDPANDRPC